MACTNNNTVKPDVVSRPNNIYGAPQGQSGRVFNGVDYGVQGIVIHCTDMTISQYVQYLACLTQPVAGVNQETNHHYSIGSSGALNQHIDDNNMSWTFGNYTAGAYTDPPAPTAIINWPTLQTLNGQNVSPDVYVVNILIAKSYNQGTTCLTSTGLPKDQHDKLIQLLAYLSATYNIPLDADHINFHDNIDTQACPANECNCDDVACLLADINTYCEEDCNTVTYSEVDCADVSHLLAVPNNCGNSSGCLVSIPFDACCLGHLAEEGDIDIFLGLSSTSDDPCDTDAQYCLVKNFINVTAPLTGQGTADDPLILDLCLFGDWVPQVTDPVECEAVDWILGIDDEGCLVQMDLAAVVAANETPITVVDTSTVDLTASGTNDHTIQADVKISASAANLITVESDGLFVGFDCDDFRELFEEDTVVSLYGVDAQGECAFEDTKTLVDRIICNEPVSDGTYKPLHILGRNENMDCPEFFTPVQVVMAGLTVTDTPNIDLELVDGELTANVIVDPASDNTFSVTSNGIYVPELTLTTLDNCISATIVNNALSIGLNVDPTADNILTCAPDGLYVKDIAVSPTDCLDLNYNPTTREITGSIILAPDQNNISNVAQCTGEGFYVQRGANLIASEPLVGDGSEVDPLDIDFSLMDNQDLCDFGGTIPDTLSLENVIGMDANDCLRTYSGEQFIAEFLLINNGDCITATLTDNVLNIEPVISPPVGALNNILVCTSTGLYVPVGGGIVATATNCIDVQLTNGILTATPILNDDPLNQLSCTADGLYVERGAGVIGAATDCIQVVAINGEITATPIIATAILGVDNIVSCEPGGLFVPRGAGITAVTTDCLTVTLDTANGELTVTPIISPLVDNIIECTANGFYVPGGFIQSVAATDCIILDITANELTATPVIDPDVTNMLECRATGLYATFTVLDTTCIDLTLDGTVLSAAPIIDPKTTNLLECGVDGLCVELNPDVFIDSDCIDFDIVNGLVTATPILAPDQGPITNILRCLPGGLYVPVGGGITTLNGNCVELELVTGVLTADVIIDTVTPDNAITCGPDGLYAPICCPLVEDTNTVDLTLNDPRTITADVIIDPDGTNILVANPNGLYVPPPFITATVDTNCIDIEVTDGILTVNPIISAEPDNALQCLVDGFHVPECCPLVIDTNTVDLTLIGDRTIQADVIIDPLADNALVANPNGLYVPPDFIDAVLDTTCIDLTVTDGVLAATPIIDPNPDNQLTCGPAGLLVEPGGGLVGAATDCIDVDITDAVVTATPIVAGPIGGINNQLQCTPTGLFSPVDFISAVVPHECIDVQVVDGALIITPIINAEPDNLLVCQDGLYVPPMTVVDGNCIDLTIVGTTITAEVIISAQDGNIVTCLADGLFAEAPVVTVADTDCIALVLNDGELTATPIIDPAVDNALVCRATGLFAPEAFITAVLDTQCIDVDVTDGVMSINPIISPLADNLLVCQGDGLYVPPLTVVDTDCIDLDITDGVLTAAVIVDPAVDNTLVCQGTGLFVPALTVVDGNCIDLTVTGTTITAEVIVSAQAENALQCLADGLWVEECCPLVLDTNTVDLTLTGTRTISADVIIDPDPTNAIVANPDGLFVPEPFITAVADHQCLDLEVVDGLLTVEPIIDPGLNLLTCGPAGLLVEPFVAVDGNCIDLTVVGNTIAAEVVISAQANNIVNCLADGLFAEAPVRTVADTDCISLALDANGELTAAPVISPALDNALQCLPDGLFVLDCCITEQDTPTVDLTLAANVLTANVIVSPLADNTLVAQADGLYVPPAAGLTGLATDCLTVTITAAGEISVDPIISPTIAGVPNTLTCEATGLFVPELQTVDTDCIALDITANVLTADPILAPDQGALTNVLQCIADQGLFVPQGAGLIVIDGNCIDLTLTDGILTAEAIVDPNVENLLTCGVDGLLAQLTVLDTDCIDLTLAAGVLSAEPIIAPDQLVPNALSCLADGLFVPQAALLRTVGATPAGGNFIDVDLDGDNLSDFQFCEGFDTIVSTNDCVVGVGEDYVISEFTLADKTLTINSVPRHFTASAYLREGTGTALGDGQDQGGVDLLFVEHDELQPCVIIVNPSPCREMQVTINSSASFIAEGWVINNPLVDKWDLSLRITDSADNVIGADRANDGTLTPSGADNSDSLNVATSAIFTIPPGGTETFCATSWIRIFDGTNTFATSSGEISIAVVGVTI